MTFQIPRRQPASAPAAFIANNVELSRHDSNFEYVPPLDMFMTESDATQQEHRIEALWISTRQHKDELFDAMDKFQRKMLKKDPSIVPMNVRACTWSQVMEEFSKAEAFHQHKHYGRFKPIFKGIRCFKKYASAIGYWVDLLPAGDYGSGLRGAFKLILGAASCLHDVESLVSAALSNIPEAINKAFQVHKIYKDQQPFELTQKTVQLYGAVMVALKNFMDYFLDHTAKRIASALVFGSDYKASLEESINNVKDCAVRIDEEAMVCLHHNNSMLFAKVTDLQQSHNREDARRREESSSKAETITVDVKDTLHVLTIKASAIIAEGQHNKIEQHQFLDVLNKYKDMLLANPRLERHTGQPRDKAKKNGSKKQSKTYASSTDFVALTNSEGPGTQGIRQQELIDLLTYNLDDLTQDVGDSCDLGEIISEEEKSDASQAARSKQLRKFLVDASKSRVLLIHGNIEDPTPTSFLSFLTGKLSLTYANTEDVFVLSYFCGLHAEIWDPKANASGMMTTIVGQLLSIPHVIYDLSFVDDSMYELIGKDDCRMLCTLFLHLMDQLPRNKVVFCFIDSISIYETEERAQDACLVLSTLTNFIKEQEDGAIFKLLVTEPGRSQYAWRYITEENDVLEMNGSDEDDGLGILEIEDGFELSEEDSL